MAEEDDSKTAQDKTRLVALYDFDPSTIDWPFNHQKPLPLTTGQVIEVIHDGGSEWALGHLAKVPESLGYFPKNYTVSVGEYKEMMRDFENQEAKNLEEDHDDVDPNEPPETRAIPAGPLPAPLPDQQAQQYYEDDDHDDGTEEHMEVPELVYPGIAEYPALQAKPTQPTAFEVTKSRQLREMPPVPDPAPEEPAPPEDDIVAARWQVETELASKQDIMDIQGGAITYSRNSTPATRALTRPERDFVRKQAPAAVQDKFLRKVSPLMGVVNTHVRLAWERSQQPFKTDLRVRHTTLRVAANIEPGHMRFALDRANDTGAKWKQMFRPGFNDIVNESFRVGCNSCILSNLYLHDKEAKEQFQKLHVKDVNGTVWFELMRKKDHLFYMRMDFIDVMMAHPDAWGFPDTNRIVKANSGEPVNPFHGWFAQHSINPDAEMEDVEFRYTLRLRSFPETTFQALALGKIPEWVKPYLTLVAEAEVPDDLAIDEDDEAPPPDAGRNIETEGNLMMEAGLEDGDDLYVKLDELKLARERTTGPDVLDAEARSYRLKGLNAMRIFLRSRGNPDNMKQALLSPKMVKDMAAQLGIQKEHHMYWYCMFALRYPLASDWEAVVRDDTRWYLNLTQDRLQPVHPMIKKFREHLGDVIQNEYLWDFRGFVKMKCSECGIPDSVVWCSQCTDYYCGACFLGSHKSRRGKKHWPLPVPGCRYLSLEESKRFATNIPLLNVGFSNRRRFLARDNQSDRNGPRTGDTWLYFHADTFQAALVQTPEKHWCLKRREPPRLPPGVDGYYYNFLSDTLADDVSYILTSTQEAAAIALLQRHIRGALTRKAIKRETHAALVLQKTKVMWDVQKIHGSSGKNAGIIKGWFRKHRAREEKAVLELKIARVQAAWRGVLTRMQTKEMLINCTRFQAAWRGIYTRRRVNRQKEAAVVIQKCLRGLIARRVYKDQRRVWMYDLNNGRSYMRIRHAKAAKIQAMVRGIFQRENHAKRLASAIRIQARTRGMFARKRVNLIQLSATKLQRNWRRFQAQLDVKRMIYEKMEALRLRRQEMLRVKLEDAATIVMQRNFRRHQDATHASGERREKGDADKRTTTMLVALFQGAAALRHYIHPWWRHLPREIQSVLKELKGPLQRTIAILPVKGKLANEELGKRGLTVANESHLHYDQDGGHGKDIDLASHLLLCISRHLLSHVPVEQFPETMKWACYSIGHQAVKLHNTEGHYPLQMIPVGKEMPPHQNDSLNTLYKDMITCQQRADTLMHIPEESMPMLILGGLPSHHRHVYLTAEVLVTMRQALNSPAISTDDHLKFQGLDASAGAQLMEVLGSEMDHRLPLDWPNTYGSVAALAQQLGQHITEEKREGATEVSKSGRPAKGGSRGGAKAAPKPQAKKDEKPKQDGEKGEKKGPSVILSTFNRSSVMRIIQQVGYLMRGQKKIMDSVLGLTDEESAKRGDGVRQGRFILMTDKLFDMADRAAHDHCSFVLAVVLFHMILRALMMRLLYHRAAIALQKRYRYLKMQARSRNSIKPAICIQRYWRGLRVGLTIARQEEAVEKIQHTFRASRWNRRSAKMLKAALNMQRLWQGALVRHWLRTCRQSAVDIQRYARGMMVRVVLDRFGREMIRKNQAELTAVMRRKNQISESEYWATCAVKTGKYRIALANHRNRNIDLRRNAASTLKSKHARLLDKAKKMKHKGTLQPARLSIFEPFPAAARRIEREARGSELIFGNVQSGVLAEVRKCHRRLERTMPLDEPDPKQLVKIHAAAKRGYAARMAKRVVKKCEVNAPPHAIMRDDEFDLWFQRQLEVKK
eukprot:TRINITY_DN1817_c0_g2_i1.p1 TRINITY_DN1817_c0_g2~~TRINITY_DN1817_c0_g2_i1.p1  ORF type:complete len:1803 (+),score=330.13 TRINITY_DN1817_c0_g2_i1:138-5546(+)